MATITVRDTILDGNLGDGWNDAYAAACALKDYQSSIWTEDLQKFKDAGHKINIDITVSRNTTGYTADTNVDIDDNDDEEGEYDLIQSVQGALTDSNTIWERFCESDAAAPFCA